MRAANVVMARRPWLSALPVIPIIAVLSGFPFILFSPRGALIFITRPTYILLLLIYIPMMLYGALKTVRSSLLRRPLVPTAPSIFIGREET